MAPSSDLLLTFAGLTRTVSSARCSRPRNSGTVWRCFICSTMSWRARGRWRPSQCWRSSGSTGGARWWRARRNIMKSQHRSARRWTPGCSTRRIWPALITRARPKPSRKLPDAEAFYSHARGTAGKLARIAGKFLGADSPVVEDLGTAYGIAGMLRAAPFLRAQGRSLLPADGTPNGACWPIKARELLAARRPPRVALAAALPAAYARRDLARTQDAPRGLGDRLAVLRAAVTGRV